MYLDYINYIINLIFFLIYKIGGNIYMMVIAVTLKNEMYNTLMIK
jgi:hypothetical protein